MHANFPLNTVLSYVFHYILLYKWFYFISFIFNSNPNQIGQSPLHLAKSTEAAQSLLAAGARVHFLDSVNALCFSALLLLKYLYIVRIEMELSLIKYNKNLCIIMQCTNLY